MTGDEIDAAIRKVTAIQPDNRDRAIFRAGMREAARILREIAADGIPNDSFTISANVLAADIERAAGGEG